MNVLIWHVHGSWMTNFVQGRHTYLVPVVADRGPDGRGRAATWEWPPTVEERTPEQLVGSDVDVVIVQSEHELELAHRWLGGRRPGHDIPLVWLEHNAPQGRINELCHPARDRQDTTIVHVTATNSLFWDTGSARTVVIEHGVIDPGRRWTGDEIATAAVINEPLRRARVTGTDLLEGFGSVGRVDLFGIGADELAAAFRHPAWLAPYDDVKQGELHDAIARRRCYLHPFRWTSLGLALIEAMMLGIPVVALATTEVPNAVPPGCGVVSNDLGALHDAVARLHADHAWGADLGAAGRAHALDHYSLSRFLTEWDQLLEVIVT